MATSTQRSRKRPRNSDAPVSEWNDYAIAVIPRHNASQQGPRECASLRETPTRANEGNQRRIASHVEGLNLAMSTRSQPVEASRAPSLTSNPSTSATCCYYCRIRGGQAAYQCVFEEGADVCRRCVSDKRRKCRLPTDEELHAIEARCQQCITRGFKTCNGQTPCEVCIKHHTEHRCRQPPRSRAKREDTRAANVLVVRLGAQSMSTRQSGKKRKKSNIEAADYDKDDKEHYPTIAEDPAMDIGPRHSGQQYSASSSIINAKECGHEQSVAHEEMALVHDYGHQDPGQEQAEDSHGDVSHKGGASPSPSTSTPEVSTKDRAVSTDATSINEEDESNVEVERHQHRLIRKSTLNSSARPRRNLGRVSYVEEFPNKLYDYELEIGYEVAGEDESDAYICSTSVESEADEDSVLGDLAEESPSFNEEEEEEEEEEEAMDTTLDLRPARPRPKQSTSHKATKAKAGKGIDFSLPPLDNIEDIFADMASKAVELGLSDVLRKLKGRYINVATMCSGTESPLLAFGLLSKALEKAGLPPVKIYHHFSAEIEVVKQGYIERNFSPPKLFRDVRDFIREDSTTATTAYGAEENIPSELDILIAGFVCKDLSRLNSRQKGLDSDGESGDTWRAIYSYAERFRPSIVLLENVKSTSSLWDEVVSKWDAIGYEAEWLICDTKRYYLPQTRERMYMIAIERSQFGKNVDKAVGQWQDLMQKLQRQCSSPYEAFLKNTLHDSGDHNALVSEPDWALCKLRYDHIRSDERLGILRPVTKWSENGTVRPPDIANRQWYNSQSPRVYDAIDVAHLQAAKKGYDSMHKMAVWDVSQNVDRFKTDLGIVPCITPGGCDFTSNRQVALSGSQLLLVQGMPLSKLLFAKETQRECQDLAGNAMSTTVIGASLLSAIICGWKLLRPAAGARLPAQASNIQRTRRSNDIVRISSMKEVKVISYETEQLNLEELRADAIMSSRLCNCEGDKRISRSEVLVCSSCEHTSCAQCAGNPKHDYLATISREQRTQTPNDFAQKWKPKLPTRLRFGTFPDLRQISSDSNPLDQNANAYINHLVKVQIQSQYFCAQEPLRQDNVWKITYRSTHAKLELRISQNTEWLLFVDSPSGLPGNSPLRKLFEHPVARAKAVNALLDAAWQFYLPGPREHTLQINGSTLRCSSWRSHLGLPDYKDEIVPKTLQVRGHAEECKALVGDFEFLHRCGTASHSLYKRSTGSDLYLFLDPSLVGKSEDDGFVFSRDCGLKHYGDTRISLAHVHTSWRPWHVKDEVSHDVDATIPGVWLPAAMTLTLADVSLTVSVPTTAKALAKVQNSCSSAIVILDAQIPEQLPVNDFDDYAWALQQARHLPPFSTWQPFAASPPHNCSCAPIYPPILWHVDGKGTATPHEDRKAAASFERAIKTRPPIYRVRGIPNTGSTQIQIALNLSTLLHRAIGRLTLPGSVTTSWRLVTDHEDLANEPFPKFQLLSNLHDVLLPSSRTMSYLRNAQPKSLLWMKNQEMGREITITEVEEAIDTNLGWRVEARAQISVSIQGGVLADLPSFGKTVTTIALIQSEFEEQSPDALIRCNQQLQAELPAHIDSAATLIVSPPHIALQWQTELEKFLGSEQFDTYNVLFVESFVQLQQLSVEDFESSKVIIVSWSVFAGEEYISHLAQFVSMPEPSVTGRRAFDTWFSRALEEVPSQLEALKGTNYDDFRASAKDLLKERLQHEDFQVTLPISIRHGSAYESFEFMQASSGPSKAKIESRPQTKRKVSSPDTGDHQVPLLHLFRFNRIVVDEYHYLNDEKRISNVVASVCVKRIPAHKRWVLSGTPALGSFSDVDQIASYLGIKLGRYHFGDGTATTQSDRALRVDQTLVEDFLAQTEVMSKQWHRARYERAQEFLDLFVRQNEAYLGYISCEEKIMPIELDIGHHAVYLELSQHLIAQKMQIKKLNNKLTSDKVDRLNASLNDSATAEDALLKSALVFETASEQSGLDLLKDKRSEQRSSTESDLSRLMAGFEGLSKTDGISELYTRFKDDIRKFNWLGDNDASQMARKLLAKAEKRPIPLAFPELKQKGLSQEKRNKLAKKLLSDVRETARELALRTRSERFIKAIRDLLQPLSDAAPGQTFQCSSPQCKSAASLSQLHLISHCGHTACKDCLSSRVNTDTCVHHECNLSVQGINLVKVTELGATAEHIAEHSYGKKLGAVTQLISGLPKADQALVFAPNDEIVAILEAVFNRHKIAYHSLRGCKASASAKVIEEFKTDDNPDKRKKVLILNLGSESAAGVNLSNANHIVFISPLLAKTQYEYDSAMAQAIARSRRYGQEKKVRIYHVIAQRTIDVDILEHRHKRVDGITTSKSSMKMPEPLAKKERTKLVRNKAGNMALVPVTWLTDTSTRKMLELEDIPSSFTSLINFSETFQHDDD